MDAALADDFRVQCVAPLAAGACPVMAADAAGLTRVPAPPGSSKGLMSWRTPGGGTLVIDAYATNVCRVILPPGAKAAAPEPPKGVRVRMERTGSTDALVAEVQG